MCMPVNSRFCLICLLAYLLLPLSSAISSADNTETTASTYIPLKEDKHAEPDETPFLQLNPGAENQSDHDESEAEHFFVHSLMKKYGNGMKMTFDGFEHLLQNIGLGNFLQFDHNVMCHRVNGSTFVALHSDHNHTGLIHSDLINKSCDDMNEHIDDSHDHHELQSSHDHVTHSHDHHELQSSHDHVTHSHDHHELPSPSDHVTHSHDHHESEDSAKNILDNRDNLGHDHDLHNTDIEHTMSKTGHEQEEHETSGTKKTRSAPRRIKKHLIDDAGTECLSPKLIINIFGKTDYRYVSEDLFTSLCPALIYQLDQKVCINRKHAHDESHEEGHFHGDEGHVHDDHEHEPEAESEAAPGFSFANIPGKVWGFSAIAVVVISLVGLLGVAVIPIMRKVFYNHLLQFLVALAVGALSGDALLHLLPHAIEGGHPEGGHDHDGDGSGEGHSLTGVYKGLCGLGGIYFFFLMERILTIVTDIKRKRKQKSKRARKHLKDNEEIGEKLASSDMECGEMMMSIHPNKALKGYADEAHSDHCKISFDNVATISHQHGSRGNSAHGNHVDVDEEEGQSMISSHSSHGHGHSHCHDGVPNSVSALAWMVIMGDGIHNLSDGLAIGAAFSNSITGGFSTAIAVFCHELPHEIGDFAVLLRAGMSAKQAVIYNCLSSILCFIGMLIGVAIGNIHEASLWIFATVGGLFLYIALVDMLPEMTSVATSKGENPFHHLILQMLGMLIGAGIMLVIALKEDDLRKVFD